MTYFPDLSSYDYWDGGVEEKEPVENIPVVNIGWLDDRHQFPIGDPFDGLVDALLKAIVVRRVRQTRGCHPCYLCRTDWITVENPYSERSNSLLGTAELRALGDGVLYAAPTLIVHYVTDHGYLPPVEFCRSVIEDCLDAHM